MLQDDKSTELFCPHALAELQECIGKETLWQLLNEMPGECTNLMAELEQALDNDNLPEARKIAHSMKGMAANYAATGIAVIAKAIEQDAVTIDDMKKHIGNLENVVLQTRDWIAKSA